ncbi:response regulator [Undibacterium sp.]|jgi:two-component system probable response regulator PhcQ|uniref:response regulator n=1 Tax=Undibacterium sp. TaxID=1914977 RepID=UPI002C9D1117|nr:response regulator [Undibacterium sp.]HTD06266.1 response regulator [Undibacterium sp.]
MRRILLVDDEQNILHALQRSLRQIAKSMDIRIELFTEPQAAIQRLGEVEFDFAISDYHMPRLDGVDFLRVAKEIQPDMVRMMLSASADFGTIMGAVNEAEVFKYIVKPWAGPELEQIVLAAIARHDQLIEERKLINEQRAQCDVLTPEEREAKRLENIEPGITKVNWGPDGSILLDESDEG